MTSEYVIGLIAIRSACSVAVGPDQASCHLGQLASFLSTTPDAVSHSRTPARGVVVARSRHAPSEYEDRHLR